MMAVGHRGRRVGALGAGALAVVAAAAVAVGPIGGAGAVGPQAAKTAKVTIKNFTYHKPKLHVSKGTKVVFANKDGATHTATAKGKFNTGKIKHGHSVAIKFKHKGTFKYLCTLHRFMKGKIVVG
jgi:plastocyanin